MPKPSMPSSDQFAQSVNKVEAALAEALDIGNRRQNAIKQAPTFEDLHTSQRYERLLWHHHTHAAAVARRIGQRTQKKRNVST